jgi:hypothetical protein
MMHIEKASTTAGTARTAKGQEFNNSQPGNAKNRSETLLFFAVSAVLAVVKRDCPT